MSLYRNWNAKTLFLTRKRNEAPRVQNDKDELKTATYDGGFCLPMVYATACLKSLALVNRELSAVHIGSTAKIDRA